MIRLFSALVLAIATVPIAKQNVSPTLQLTDVFVAGEVAVEVDGCADVGHEFLRFCGDRAWRVSIPRDLVY